MSAPRPDGPAGTARRAASRPGGRTARTTAAVLQATLAELGERGYARLTVEGVATRAGVHKATVYRRWGGADGLLAAALERARDDDWAPRRTGALRTDLEALAREVADYFALTPDRSVASAAIGAAFESDRVAEALHGFFADRHRRAAAIVAEAVDRGEAPRGTDGEEVVRAVVAPVYHRLFVSREPVGESDVRRAARIAAEAAAAGAFAGGGG